MVLDEQALGGQQFPEELAAHMAQVAGADGIELLRLGVGIGEVAQELCRRSRSHGGPHVVDVPDLIVLHPPEGHGPDADPLPGGAQQTGPGGGGRPLGGRGADGSIAQRGAELAFGGAEMAGCHGQQAVGQPG